ncbi:hypothetical protein F610DRAFT_04416 [Streptomyces sp. LaPpAH-199]|nr:hypothetical protein F610DRAFT_04416 [Streptomyces sp. LaPpAH-199]
MRTAGRYARASEEERLLMDRFLVRTHRFQTRTMEAVESLGLARLDVGGGRTVEELADAVMATAARPNRSGG